MAHRHKHHAKHKNVGGGTVAYTGGGSNVAKEAKEKGAKHGGKVHGHKGHHRTYARGGGVGGSDKHPFSSAHVVPHQPAGNPHPHNLGKTHSGG